MNDATWSSPISPHRPPVPAHWHWGISLVLSSITLSGAVYWTAVRTMPESVPAEEVVESVIVSLGAPAQRLEPPPPLPPDIPEPEIVDEPPKLAERSEEAPPPEAPPQPRPVVRTAPSAGSVSSGFGDRPAPPPPPPPPPPKRDTLRRDFTDISTAQYVRRVVYPRRAVERQIQGAGELLVIIDRSGAVLDWELRTSTGSSILDREIIRVARDVSQLDPLPDYYGLPTAKLVIPFKFYIAIPN